MVFAAPLFIASQSVRFRALFAANREPLFRLGLGSTVVYVALRLLSKTYEANQLAADLERSSRWRASVEALLQRPDWVAGTAGSVRGAAAAAGGEAALRAAVASVLEEASGALVLAESAARKRSAWVVGLEERMPKSGALEAGRARAQAASEEARALASATVGNSSSGTTGSSGATASSSSSSAGAAAAPSLTRRLI